MKMKKLLIVVSMLAVMFSLAACDNEKAKPFDYDETQIVLDAMYMFGQYDSISEEYVDYYIADGTEFEKSAVKGVQQVINTDKVGDFESYDKYLYGTVAYEYQGNDGIAEIEKGDDYVSVSVINKAANRDVKITVKFVENPEYYIQYAKYAQDISVESVTYYINNYLGQTVEEYLAENNYATIQEAMESLIAQEITSSGIYKYIPEEMVVNAVYSKGELMGQAATNTLIGMGTVFIVLIFISFIISLFKYLPALFAKKASVPEPKAVAKQVATPAASVVAATNDLMNDAELVAVITAAVYAMSGSQGSAGASVNNADSKDKLIVRSIKRAKK